MDRTSVFVTSLGGHLGPAEFRLGSRIISPFSVAPWHKKPPRGIPALLAVLRGDFFCFPFGGNAKPFRREKHPPHGETANRRWKLVSQAAGHLHLRMHTRQRAARVDKHIFLRPGQTAIYQRHIISGASGPMNLGHHAMLRFPDGEGTGLVATSPFARGQVCPEVFEEPARRGYSCLRPGARFQSLSRVPTIFGGHTDLSRYPARRGYEDLVMLMGRPTSAPFAWTAVTFPRERYVWFALKDPRVLANTVLWHSNGGRHYSPWNGQHLNVLGLEEVTSYFHHGLAESFSPNPVTRAGGRTYLQLNPNVPLVINYIMAVAPVPRGFDHVARILPGAKGGVDIVSRCGLRIHSAVDPLFISGAASSPWSGQACGD